jgi:hypothetical protein
VALFSVEIVGAVRDGSGVPGVAGSACPGVRKMCGYARVIIK